MYHVDNIKFRDFSSPGLSGMTGSVIKSSLEKNSAIGKIQLYDCKTISLLCS